METPPFKQLGKLLLNNNEVYVTSPFTILGRTSEFTPSKELKGTSLSKLN